MNMEMIPEDRYSGGDGLGILVNAERNGGIIL